MGRPNNLRVYTDATPVFTRDQVRRLVHVRLDPHLITPSTSHLRD